MQDAVQIENVEELRKSLLQFIHNELLQFEKEHEIDVEKEISMEQIKWVRKRS